MMEAPLCVYETLVACRTPCYVKHVCIDKRRSRLHRAKCGGYEEITKDINYIL